MTNPSPINPSACLAALCFFATRLVDEDPDRFFMDRIDEPVNWRFQTSTFGDYQSLFLALHIHSSRTRGRRHHIGLTAMSTNFVHSCLVYDNQNCLRDEVAKVLDTLLAAMFPGKMNKPRRN